MATILLIVNELPLLRLYEGALSLGHKVTAVEKLDAARESAGQVQPDLIVYDVNRTNYRDLESLQILNRMSRQAGVPLLIMAEKDHRADVPADDFAGEYLSKPVTVSVLRRSIDMALNAGDPADQADAHSGHILHTGNQPV